MSADPKLRAKVKRIAKLEMFYRFSSFWRMLLVSLTHFFIESQSTKDIGPVAEWLLTRELIRSSAVCVSIVWAGPFLLYLLPIFCAKWLNDQFEMAPNPMAILTETRLWRVTTLLCINKILLVLELLSELGCIWVLSEGIPGLKPLSPLFLHVEIGVSMIYMSYRVASLRLVARFVKELQQDSSCFELTQIQEQTSNSVPPKQTSIAIPD